MKIHFYPNLVPRVLSYCPSDGCGGRVEENPGNEFAFTLIARRSPWEFWWFITVNPVYIVWITVSSCSSSSSCATYKLGKVWVGLSHPKFEVIRNPGNFLMESGILALGIRNLAKWIRNPANDWDSRDPESTFHLQEKWNPVPVIRNP